MRGRETLPGPSLIMAGHATRPGKPRLAARAAETEALKQEAHDMVRHAQFNFAALVLSSVIFVGPFVLI